MDKCYVLREDPEDEKQWCIEVTVGKYMGLAFRYGNVRVGEEEDENGNLPFGFSYSIIHQPDETGIPMDDSNDEMVTLMGDILVDVMSEELERREDESNRTDNPEPSDK